MNLTDRFVGALDALMAGGLRRRFQEGVGLDGTDNDDEFKYRRITNTARDLKPMEFKRIMDGSYYIWQRNALGRRLIDILIDFTVGNDLEVVAKVYKQEDKTKVEDEDKSADAQALWDKFADDPYNRFMEDIDVIVQDLLIFGELLLPVATNEANKMPRYGFVDVGTITKVKRDTSGRLIESVFITVTDDGTAKEKEIKVLRKEQGAWMGEAFYFQHSRTLTKSRGQSFLTELLDWLDALDQFEFNALEGSALRNAFFYTMNMKTATKEQLEAAKKAGADQPPKPGTVKLHNDAVEWNVVSPNLQAGETSEAARHVKNLILGAKGYPEHWLADGGNTNMATAEKMDIPVMQMLKRQQKKIKEIIAYIARYVIEVQSPGNLELADGEVLEVTINTVDLERSDAAALGSAFTSIVTALQTATGAGWMTDEKAKEIIDTLITRYGVTPDKEEIDEIRKKNQDRRQEEEQGKLEEMYRRAGVAPPAKGGPPKPTKPEPNFTRR